MGEFQRNVGNYAIAGQNGVVSTESLMTVLKQQAITTKDVADQSKILLEARSMLDTSDAGYSNTVSLINEKLAENNRRLSDVSDIMDVQATSAAEAEAQNKRLTEALKQVDQSSEDADKTISELNAKIEENNKVIEAGSGGKASIKKDLRQMVLAIANLSIEYQNLSEEEKASAKGQELAQHIQELTEQAGVLKDAIADTNAAITNAASDTRGFDQLGGTIQLAIDGFGLATGAAEMLGISEGELATIQTKLQAAIAASNAMTKIQNALQKQSAVIQGVNLVQTKLRTVAENIHTAAQGKNVIVTKAATVAQWAFNAAANANPIGVIIVAVVACIAAVWGLVKAFEAFVGPSKEATKECEEMVKQTNNLIESNEALIESMERRGESYAKVHAQIIKNLQEEYAEMVKTLSYAETHDVSSEAYENAVAQYAEGYAKLGQAYFEGQDYFSKMIREAHDEELEAELGAYEARRRIIEREFQEYEEYANRILALGNQLGYMSADLLDWNAIKKKKQRMLAEVDADEQKANESARRTAADAAKRRQQEIEREASELKKQIQAGEDALLKLITDTIERQRQAEILSYNRKLKDLQDRLAKTKDTEIELRTALNRQIEGLTAEHTRKLAELEIAASERRLKAESDIISSHLAYVKEGSKEEYDLKLKSLENQYQQELLTITKAEAANTVTVEQAAELRANLVLKYDKLRDDTEEEFARNSAEREEKKYADIQATADNAYISALNALKQRYAKEMAAAKGNSAKQAEIKEKFEREQAELAEDYAVKTAQNSVAMLEEILKTEQLSAEDRAKYEAQLAKAKGDLETAMADQAIANINRISDADSKAKEQRMANAQQWLQVASDSLGKINELVSTIYDAKIQKVEEEQEANTEAGEAEVERITELVNQKVITEEEGEARKRAAEAKTAKKNEELEKKKQQLKHKQAVWDKANSVAQAGIATALAIMNALQMKPFPVGIAMAAIAGAMGAVQIATILATPIPKYAKGTDYHRGGPAIVGDGGRQEIVLVNGGAWITPDKPTLVDMPAGAVVIPSVNDFNNTEVMNDANFTTSPNVVVNSDHKKIEDKMDKVIYLFSNLNQSHREGNTLTYLGIMKVDKGL